MEQQGVIKKQSIMELRNWIKEALQNKDVKLKFYGKKYENTDEIFEAIMNHGDYISHTECAYGVGYGIVTDKTVGKSGKVGAMIEFKNNTSNAILIVRN